jgi:3-dehydroquinate synthase
MVALLYMRGLPYINVPTSLMAQIDAGIGGKVGVNFGSRKNLLGGFHLPLLVLVDADYLITVPMESYIAALSEALKIGIILPDSRLLSLLEGCSEAILLREPAVLTELVELCVQAKIDLLADDVFEINLGRELNLGHSVAHALELLPVMPGRRPPLHGEAVAIGLAAKIRYAFHHGLCSRERAMRLLETMIRLRLPLQPGIIPKREILDQLGTIQEHRGGLFRLVVPVDPGGVRILETADPDVLVECLKPIAGLA